MPNTFRVFELCLLALLLLICLPMSHAQTRHLKPEGAMSYTPSRLEWLAVVLSARDRVVLSTATGYSLDFIPVEKENAILIVVFYYPTLVDRENLDKWIESERQVINIYAKSMGWSSWLKVREKVEIRELPKH